MLIAPMETYVNFALDRIRRSRFTFSNESTHIATFSKELPISLERMYENALDWEHLPHLHSSSFSYIKLIESGRWGWRAKLGGMPRSRLTDLEVTLTLDRDKYLWITKTVAGFGKGSEVWTRAIPLAERRIKVIVDFYVPKVPAFLKSLYADKYIALYTKLYEEDFTLDNIETDMPAIFDNYYGDLDKRSCPNCGEVMQPPKKVQLED